MINRLETRDILLFIIAVMLVINTFLHFSPRKLEADTFKVDDCITVKPDARPAAYLHVVTHQ
jgi:hypothetical protein